MIWNGCVIISKPHSIIWDWSGRGVWRARQVYTLWIVFVVYSCFVLVLIFFNMLEIAVFCAILFYCTTLTLISVESVFFPFGHVCLTVWLDEWRGCGRANCYLTCCTALISMLLSGHVVNIFEAITMKNLRPDWSMWKIFSSLGSFILTERMLHGTLLFSANVNVI